VSVILLPILQMVFDQPNEVWDAIWTLVSGWGWGWLALVAPALAGSEPTIFGWL